MLRRQPKHQALSDKLKLERLTKRSPELANLLKQASRLQSLDSDFEFSLPPALKKQFKVNGIENGHLIVTCHSAAMATRFRMSQKAVLQKLVSRTGLKITSIKIKIRPQIERKAQNRNKQRLSQKNAQLLLSEAGHTDDEKLKNILIKLAKSGQN